jgi:hypothetical protein
MKTVLLVGCGSKFGNDVLNNFKKIANNIFLITSSKIDDMDIEQLIVDWDNFNVVDLEKFLKKIQKIDFVFFNQNGSALSDEVFNVTETKTLDRLKLQKKWQQSYFNSCILPFHIIHSLKKAINYDSKFCWMLSNYCHTFPKNKNIGHADYIGNKQQNFLIMKNFSYQDGCFFGINPDSLQTQNYNYKADQFIEVIDKSTTELNGKVFYLDGKEDTRFNNFFNW